MSWKWNEREELAFAELHDHRATVLYLRGLRRHMDYKTGIVGVERKISYRMFIELLEERREVGSTKPDFIPTREVVRWMIKKLEGVGLVQRLPSQHIREPMVFKLPLASVDADAVNMSPLLSQDPVVDSAAAAPVVARGQSLPPCPHQQILEIWDEVMPPHIRRPRRNLWTPGRRAYIQLADRWKQCFGIVHSKRQEPLYHDLESGLKWWRGFFEYCKRSDFLMNRCRPFQLPWIVNKENFIKIQEGNYE